MLKLTDLNNGSVFIGDKLGVRAKFVFEEETSILWSGVRLITKPPCGKKKLQISKEEIFTMGKFEAGEYIRDRNLLIKYNVVPTIKQRNLNYVVELIFRTENPINADEDLLIKKSQQIEIKVKETKLQTQPPNPISLSISGLNVNLSKDTYKPGETIKINFKAKNLKDLEVRLLQKANLVCYCEPYGKNCQNVEELPPAIAGDVKTSNFDKEFLLLKVPEIAEPTHNYLYLATEKEYWGIKYGDYSQWSLLIIGKKKPEFGREDIRFDIPIVISTKPPLDEVVGDIDLFSNVSPGGMRVFDEISSKLQNRFQLISIDLKMDEVSNLNRYRIRIKNVSDDSLKGISIKLSGLQEGLFETRAELLGFNTWEKGQIKELIYRSKQNVSAIILIIEDNSRKSVRIQTPISF